MNTPHRSPMLGHATHALALGLVLLSGSLAGCGEDKAQNAIDDASRKLTSINAGANGRQWSSDRVYESVKTAMSNLPGSPSDEQKAAASLMVAQAERGLAERDASQASDLMGEALLLVGPAEAQLRAFASASQRAEEARQFDASPALAELKTRTDEVNAEIRDITQQIAERRAEASALRDQVESMRAKANEHRLRAADLQAQADASTAVAGVDTSRRAHEARREADGVALEALAIEQDAIAIEQVAAELEILKDKSEQQLAALAKAKESVQQRAARMTEEAATAQTDAQAAAREFQALLSGEGGLDQFHATRIPEPFDQAISQYQASIRSAQAARSVERGSASLAVALANHASANLHVARAEGLLAYASVLDAAARQGVPGASEYANRGNQARQRAAEHSQAAAAAYEQAVDGYEGSGSRGEAETLESLAGRLRELQSMVLDQQVAPESFAPATAPRERSSAAAPADGGGDSSGAVRDAIRGYQQAVAQSDGVEAVAFLHPAGEKEAGFLQTLGTLAVAGGNLDNATEQAFGEKFSVWAEANPQAMGPMGGMNNSDMMEGPLANIDLNSMDIRVAGDEAVAMLDDGSSIKLARVNGQWKQVFSFADLDLPPGAEQGFAMMDRMVGPLEQLMNSLAARVEAGELESNQAVATEMVQAMMAGMRDMMGGGNGG